MSDLGPREVTAGEGEKKEEDLQGVVTGRRAGDSDRRRCCAALSGCVSLQRLSLWWAPRVCVCERVLRARGCISICMGEREKKKNSVFLYVNVYVYINMSSKAVIP